MTVATIEAVTRFWRCDRCSRVRLTDEQQTLLVIEERVGTSLQPRSEARITVCTACVRQLMDEASARGGLKEDYRD